MQIPMIDTLIAMIDVEDYNENIITLKEELEKNKQEAKTVQLENESKIISIKIGDMTFEVLPNGKRGYAYILHNDLYEINLAQYRSKNKDFFPVYIKIKSECLWSYSPEGAWSYIYEWVNKNIGKPINNKLSRIDLCCHTDEFSINYGDVENFKGLFYTKNLYEFRRKISGINFGSSASNKIYCRIYNKVLEITQKKSKLWFFEIWKDRELNPKTVWNVEFQINREYLMEHGINTVLQAFDSLGSLWDYCTKSWLVKIIKDDSNISRCSIDPGWLIMQEAFKEFRHENLIKREKQLNDDAEALLPSAYGVFTTYAAKKGISDPLLAFAIFNKNGERYLQSKKLDFQKVIKKKQALIKPEEKKKEIYTYNEIGEIETVFDK